jgi:hypothetical protein
MTVLAMIVCDTCGRVISTGPRDEAIRALRNMGGRAFAKNRHGELVERPSTSPWITTRRHLCGDCINAPLFADGASVPRERPAARSARIARVPRPARLMP